jgi:uncharacterized repeat protein (TIGR03803 family)
MMKILRIPLVIVLAVVAGQMVNASAQTETNLYSFGSYPNDGVSPQAGLVQGSDSNFYGTTRGGGTNDDGTVFRISPSGSYTSLYAFGSSPNDGANPYAGLVQGLDGNFYGTTFYGGTNSNGTVFRISPSGTYTTVYRFVGPPADGANPLAPLVQGSDSNFYGTTWEGGTNRNGTVFRISPSGTYTSLYAFGSTPNDGMYSQAGLVQGSDGNLYGTTVIGGMNHDGTVFRISPSGTYTSLYSFVGPPNDGADPYAGLVQGSDGNFYGSTRGGGTNNYGVVFRISPGGTYTSLYAFGNSPNDGRYSQAGLVQGSDSNFYGMAEDGGTNNNGTVFQISPSGTYTTLYRFVGSPNDGANPYAGLVQGLDGSFYGTTEAGGMSNGGAVVRLSVSLNSPPSANFSGNPTNGSAPLTVTFTDNSTGAITNRFWSFGDGGTSNTTATSVQYVYQASGSNSVALIVSGPGGSNTNTKPNYIVVGSAAPPPPVASFTASPTNGVAPLPVTFTDNSTGNVTNWFWVFGDGGTTNLTTNTVVYAYNTAGVYTVTEIVSGVGGSSTDTVANDISVLAPPPVAGFTASPTNGAAPLSVNFTDDSSGSITGWAWAFGDGNTSTRQNPSDTYTNPGVYAVQEIVSGPGGSSTDTVVNLVGVFDRFAWWQIHYFGSTNNNARSAPGGDYTGTGMSNTNKFMAGFNPTNAAAYLHVISLVEQSVAGNTNNVVVTYLGPNGDNTYTPGTASRTNVLDYTTGDANGNYTNGGWQDTGQTNILSGGNGSGTVTNMTDTAIPRTPTNRYYRVRVLLP